MTKKMPMVKKYLNGMKQVLECFVGLSSEKPLKITADFH